MGVVFQKSPVLTDVTMHYCPGCTHGIVHRIIAESLDELDLAPRAIGVAPVGCGVFAYNYFNVDFHEAAHGRAPAVATGIKRCQPDRIVFTYQGDGDLASIGNAEVNHAAMRGEKITTVFINNCIYGMTGGQMAPTTLVGQRATTAPLGRDSDHYGFPMKVAEMIATHDGAYYVERVSVDSTKNIIAAKKAIKKAFKYQAEGKGFNLIEVLSTCPSNWAKTPVESIAWLRENMMPVFPLGVNKDNGGAE